MLTHNDMHIRNCTEKKKSQWRTEATIIQTMHTGFLTLSSCDDPTVYVPSIWGQNLA